MPRQAASAEASTSVTRTVSPSARPVDLPDVGTLRLRGDHVVVPSEAGAASSPSSSGPSVRWVDDTVDNEFLGRKKSKICCIYKKPRRFDESSSDESSSDEDGDAGSGDGDSKPDANGQGSAGGNGKNSKKPRRKHHHHNHPDGECGGDGSGRKRVEVNALDGGGRR